MTDWVFYSPTARLVSAGDLLRAIPSRRNMRLERSVLVDGEPSVEPVRAAEVVFGLHGVLRLINEPAAAIRVSIEEATRATRETYGSLNCAADPAPSEIRVAAELSMFESAVMGGHDELVDDLLAGLETVFPGGVGVHRSTSQTIRGAELVSMCDSARRRWSHVDAYYVVTGGYRDYLTEKLTQLPPQLHALVGPTDDGLKCRGRLPLVLSETELSDAHGLLIECASFAKRGRVRFRNDGVWADAVDGIGQNVAPLPPDWAGSRGGVRSIISRLFGR